jgi:hypothetical protein
MHPPINSTQLKSPVNIGYYMYNSQQSNESMGTPLQIPKYGKETPTDALTLSHILNK